MLKYNCWDYYSGSQGTLVSRCLNMGSGTYGVGFKMYRDNYSFYSSDKYDKVEVFVNTLPDTTGATKLGTINRYTDYEPIVSEQGWYDYAFEIPTTFVENLSYIILVATSDYGTNIYVDEFVVGKTSTVTLVVNPGEAGILTGGGSHIVGTGVNLKATANSGYKFINWTNEANEVVSTAETYNYVVGDSNVTFTANFEQLTTVTFTIVDAENDPIEGATVTVKQEETVVDTAVSNSVGEAVVYADNGNYTYSVTALGYFPKNDVLFTINGDTAINVQLDELPPALEITPDTFSFEPTQFATSSAPQIFILQNIGGGTVTINPSDITITGEDADQFILINIEDTVSLGAEEMDGFAVVFTPDTIGEKTAIIQVNDNLENIHEIVINGSAVDFTITEFPYTESFDGEKFPPLGWLSLGEKPWERVTSGSNPTCDPFGAGMLKYNCWSYSTGNQGTLVSRRLDMGSGTYGVGFKMYRDNTNSYSGKKDKVEVFVNTLPDTIDATKLGTINRYTDYEPIVSEQGWYDYVFEIPATFVESPSYIILVATSDYGTNIFVDEFVVGQVRAVTLAANPSEGGSVAGGGSYLEGTEATLTATPNAGYVLTSWTDAANEVVSKKQTFNYLVGDSDVTFTANFELGYTVTFTVVDAESNPIEGTSIVINEDTLITNASGVAIIDLANGNYDYTVSKSGYAEMADSLVVSNAPQTVTLSLIATGMDELTAGSVRLYPNPVESSLIIERNNSDEATIQLYNASGILIGTIKADHTTTTTINVGALSSGSYFVRIIGTDNTPTVCRFIKK
ncbi:MAG: Bacterial Ig-like domain (group 1) [Bacteroidetes bacterium ADurb.Bin174]|nr:MAG: Bacterial Ig-like domain (group 1) [Bacteroidetes bacterium ADurb.Bin174]